MSKRLNLFLVSSDPDFFPSGEMLENFRNRLARDLLADVLGDVIGTGTRLVAGGAAQIRLDMPATPVVWSNKSGGFSVSCADCAAPMVKEFSEGLATWKSGVGNRVVDCNVCNKRTSIENLRFRPPAALGRIAIAIRDVGGTAITPMCRELAEELLGPELIVVMSRG